MTTHLERLLLAEADYQAALEFRAVAEETLKLHERSLELYLVVEDVVPVEVVRARDTAWLEMKQLSRICLHHAAREVDKSLRAAGWESDVASWVTMWDIENPVALAA